MQGDAKVAAAFLMLSLVLLAAEAAAENLVVNGGFEQPVVSGGVIGVIGPGSGLIGWTVSDSSIDHVRALWDAAEGAQSISLNQAGAATLSQTIATNAGEAYRLSFSMAAEVFGGGAARTMDVFWDGNLIGAPSFSYTGQGPATMGWVHFNVNVPGDGSDVLTFRSTTPGDYGPALDNVAVTPSVSGDYDFDFDADGADALAWQRNLGATGLFPPADGNLDGLVDAADLQVWRNHFGEQSAPSEPLSRAVPETCSRQLLLLGILGLATATPRVQRRRNEVERRRASARTMDQGRSRAIAVAGEAAVD